MDRHGPSATNENSADRVAAAGKPPSEAATGKAQEAGSGGGEVIDQAKKAAGEVLDQAKGAAEKVIDQTKQVATDALTSLAEDFAERAPEIGRQLGDKAGAAAENLYREGGEYLSQKVEAYPLAALLVAGAVGYGLGFLLSRR